MGRSFRDKMFTKEPKPKASEKEMLRMSVWSLRCCLWNPHPERCKVVVVFSDQVLFFISPKTAVLS